MSGVADHERPAGLKVSVARTTDEVERLRERWPSAELTDIDADIDFFLAVVRGAGSVIRPHVILIEREGVPDLWAIARLERVQHPLALGYWVLCRPVMRTLVVCFGGIHGPTNTNEEDLILAELLRGLRTGQADLLLIRNLDNGGSLLDGATRSVGWLLRPHGLSPAERWIAATSGSLSEFLAGRSSKTRNNLLRRDRSFSRTFGDRVEVRTFGDAEDFVRVRQDMRTVAARSYQDRLGVAYSDSQLEQEIVSQGLSQGWFRAWIVYIDEVPVAFWSGTYFNGVFATWSPGFDPDFGHQSVGRFTMFRMIEDLCQDPDVKILDFGSGDADYKREFGETRGRQVDFYAVSRRPMPILLNLSLSALAVVNTQGRTFAKNSKVGRRVKSAWRKGMQARSPH